MLQHRVLCGSIQRPTQRLNMCVDNGDFLGKKSNFVKDIPMIYAKFIVTVTTVSNNNKKKGGEVGITFVLALYTRSTNHMSQLFFVRRSDTELRPEQHYCSEQTCFFFKKKKVSRLKMFGTMLPYCNFPP
jgi:hypothetical protein